MKKAAKALADVDLDKVIHERSRLMVLTYLSSSEWGQAGFTELRDALGFSAGNLSVQVKTLEAVGYVETEKSFVANKSYTEIRLTTAGEKALKAYLGELEIIVASLKAGAEKGGSSGGSAAIQGDPGLSQGR